MTPASPSAPTVIVRDVAATDVPAVDALLRAAFPREDEALLVMRLCGDGDMVLALVAEDEASRAVTGMVAFSRMTVESNGVSVPAVALAPLAVIASARGQGVGEALVRAGLERLEAAGVVLCFALGDPAFYARFGFDPALAAGYASPYAGPYLMAAALQGGLVPCGPRGAATHAAAFARLESEA
ncbi:GNAT family N-acetyltransferase [Sphingomonas solaris]|uniref:N-acetyltransferase n=1 Tax=Alterirhizorhabdus solaris TaxID=2529389 RepID=A0A558R4W8_9SPHN|nr:N-acetyltransferase [Sphingomonas solaris]TVV74382.1 N-acetyltransferase [Sphingomonas solaris]